MSLGVINPKTKGGSRMHPTSQMCSIGVANFRPFAESGGVEPIWQAGPSRRLYGECANRDPGCKSD